MKKLHSVITFLLLVTTLFSFAQQKQQTAKVKVTGKVIEKSTNQPLEYASIYAQNTKNASIVSGGMTDAKGEFTFDVPAGVYYIKVEFLGFKTVEFKDKAINSNTNLGTIAVAEDSKQLDEVVIVAEKSTVDIKLDKKVYNVGKDMTVKGGTASDVLDNVPSVSVDADGNVSLRGNESVRILIDGKPSGMIGVNVAQALKQLPADAVEKVEVITNPSARYDAEGGGGIVNIILKKGKAQGLNGSVTGTVGYYKNNNINGNVNFRGENFNLFTSIGYNNSESPGNYTRNSEYTNPSPGSPKYIDEKRENERQREGHNANFGMEWFLNKSTSWTNSLSFSKNDGANPEDVNFYNYDENRNLLSIKNRFNNQTNNSRNFNYSSNLTKNFKKDGHKLTADISFSTNYDNDISTISETTLNSGSLPIISGTLNNQKQNRSLFQTDYVLPIGKGQFEAGYRGDFSETLTDYKVEENIDPNTNAGTINPLFTNNLQYKEKVNALYTQYGNKVGKFSYLLGMRFEDTNVDVNLLTTSDFNNKRYNNFFPSAFLTYEIAEKSSVSVNYSKRINRPRGRFLNPFSNYSSNLSYFKGNPDINPSFTDAFDIGFMKQWSKLTFNTSAYFNSTKNSFQFIQRESGTFVDGTPVIESTPINLATEYRTGFEFTLNYTPYKWWRLNGNFNMFRNETQGDYKYTNYLGNEVVQNFDNVAFSWFARVSSKISLPYGIDWQTNATYNAPQKNAQGKSLGIASANLAFSKDVLKDKGTISLNVNDVFNSRKRIFDSNLPQAITHTEMQWRQRQINLSFTYRFNKKKTEKERPVKNGGDNGDDYIGG
ncbi:putative TonB-dependent receptor [Flavobacterium cauense R2A-7]|uniref:Outer membrane receptor protein involved in Fe transport n=1 Tax=Flavobacterium cauense R2A-7 TaxID=1341154 RepID=V6S2W3_9FLAO|nr:outer membrane beta-barrel family protein [Flavobacterium cauense]ESU18710.1 putative TonB-dependent receptor [Flavobacterium cauense R2A-7]KGO81814.1 TonB-dependent receptor [Flavobacterium cauense R2A-7]TWI13847.1 outer membrane receptor protein involved in Fe transport [Flavobacterium cauense R2A-7]